MPRFALNWVPSCPSLKCLPPHPDRILLYDSSLHKLLEDRGLMLSISKFPDPKKVHKHRLNTIMELQHQGNFPGNRAKRQTKLSWVLSHWGVSIKPSLTRVILLMIAKECSPCFSEFPSHQINRKIEQWWPRGREGWEYPVQPNFASSLSKPLAEVDYQSLAVYMWGPKSNPRTHVKTAGHGAYACL